MAPPALKVPSLKSAAMARIGRGLRRAASR
jgi:hypothetical protein